MDARNMDQDLDPDFDYCCFSPWFKENNSKQTKLIEKESNWTNNESRLKRETKKKKKKKLIRVSMEETRNQTEENRVVAIAEAEQAWTCSDTIREE